MTFTKDEKIRFQHIDNAGIVFYPRFLEMLNCLVEDWFEEALDLPFHEMHETNGIPTINLEIKFKSPARLGDVIQKHLEVEELGRSSIKVNFSFTNGGIAILEGKVTLVYVAINPERDGIKSEAIPPELIAKITPYIRTHG